MHVDKPATWPEHDQTARHKRRYSVKDADRGRNVKRMPKLPKFSSCVGKRHSQDVMGPHTSCAVVNLGPEKHTEVKIALPQAESTSRPRENQATSSQTSNAVMAEESSTIVTREDEFKEKKKKNVSWSQSSSESDSRTGDEYSTDGKSKNNQVWEIPIENAYLADENEEEDYAMLPQIQLALEIMLNNAPTRL